MSSRATQSQSPIDRPTGSDTPAVPRRHLVGQVVEGQLHGIATRARRSGLRGRELSLPLDQAPDAKALRPIAKSSVTIVLPRSMYLSRSIELPSVDPATAAQMLQLEIEAKMPIEFGDAYVSHRRTDATAQGRQGFEVYIARRRDVDDVIETLLSQGVHVDRVLPSALIWYAHLSQPSANPCAIAQTHTQELEAASLASDGQLMVRNMAAGDRPDERLGMVAECIRPLLASSDAPEGQPVDWIGPDCPRHTTGVSFNDVTERYVLADVPQVQWPLVSMGASLLSQPQHAATVGSANLLPHAIVESRRRRIVQRRFACASCLFLASMLVVWVSLKLAGARYIDHCQQIESQISGVRASGELVGRQIDQLRAVRAAVATRYDFIHVVSGLHRGTPSGVHYSQISFDDQARLQLRGYAESLALPFLLPEKLEALATFDGVKLIDAGQAKQAGGSVAEFRLEAQLDRPGRDQP